MRRLGWLGSACLVIASIAALALPREGTAHVATLVGMRSAPHFALVDVGTFGGADAQVDGPAVQIAGPGAVLGTADTKTHDADSSQNAPFGTDPFITHAFSWQSGHLTDLGALAPAKTNSSAVFEVNSGGVGAGASETGSTDQLLGTPAQHAVMFDQGAVTDLGTLSGGTESFALAINDNGQIAGMSNNGVSDQFGIPGFYNWSTEIRSFVWQIPAFGWGRERRVVGHHSDI
jgi:uncharacterized membrane protein